MLSKLLLQPNLISPAPTGIGEPAQPKREVFCLVPPRLIRSYAPEQPRSATMNEPDVDLRDLMLLASHHPATLDFVDLVDYALKEVCGF